MRRETGGKEGEREEKGGARNRGKKGRERQARERETERDRRKGGRERWTRERHRVTVGERDRQTQKERERHGEKDMNRQVPDRRWVEPVAVCIESGAARRGRPAGGGKLTGFVVDQLQDERSPGDDA